MPTVGYLIIATIPAVACALVFKKPIEAEVFESGVKPFFHFSPFPFFQFLVPVPVLLVRYYRFRLFPFRRLQIVFGKIRRISQYHCSFQRLSLAFHLPHIPFGLLQHLGKKLTFRHASIRVCGYYYLVFSISYRYSVITLNHAVRALDFSALVIRYI